MKTSKAIHSLITAAALATLIGCGGASQLPPPGAQSGNFLREPPNELEAFMAVDAADLLDQLYPHQTTAFQVQRPRHDDLGAKLAAELEHLGYSVLVGGTPDEQHKQLRYVADSDSQDESRFFMSMKVNGRPMNRAYRCGGGRCGPDGPWTVMAE